MTYIKKMELRVVKIDDAHPLSGLELVTRPVQVGYLSKLASLLSDVAGISQRGDDSDARQNLAEVEEKTTQLFAMFADKIKSWNYQMETEDGDIVDVPATAEGFQSIGNDLEVFDILNAWLTALAGVNADLGKESSSGEASLELSALTEPLSANLAS